MKHKFMLGLVLLPFITVATSYDHLPPLSPWSGKSESLINKNKQQQTPAELTDLIATPNYEQTLAYIHQLSANSHYLQLTTIGTTAQGRDIVMVLASRDGHKDAKTILANNKPTLLVQAGIHSGEIDGKDAGLMLLRDISLGKEKALIDQVNLLFIPILSADAHERSSAFNRVNQRGPEQMGWRTNSRNLNLNRDYSKLDTPEVRSVVEVINQYQPDLYLDIHVTDGEDYQYDITYGSVDPETAVSSHIAHWLKDELAPYLNLQLSKWGHKPGPLTFAMDPKDFAKGIVGWSPTPRYSDGYGDWRQLPTILVENHSLKPYRQRVLGTYVFIKACLELLATKNNGLEQAIAKDQHTKSKQQVLAYAYTDTPKYISYAGISYERYSDEITGQTEVKWLGQPVNYDKLPIFPQNVVKTTVVPPKAYIVPVQYHDVIDSLKAHGLTMTVIDEQQAKIVRKLEQSQVETYQFDDKPFEGRQRVTASFSTVSLTTKVPAGSVIIPVDQPLGRLAVALLEPQGPDSYFAWGFFNSIFQRTEYIENYAIIPLAKQMLAADPKLKQVFADKLANDPEFAKDPGARLDFFYQQTPYYDQTFQKYPVLRVR